MNKNRLRLDFSLNTNSERSEFLNRYLEQKEFQLRPPTEDELELMANYVLWGKDPQSGLNVKQEKYIQLESKNKTWDTHEDESLDALIEQPTFNEAQLLQGTPYKTPKVVFSRKEMRDTAPPHLLDRFEQLWAQIDELDLLTSFYDLEHGRRTQEPRAALLNKFNEEQRMRLRERAEQLSQFKYLKMRHLLVELRREQYTLRDSIKTPITLKEEVMTAPALSLSLSDMAKCAPCGLVNEKTKLFPDGRFPLPQDFSQDELGEALKDYWVQKTLREKEPLMVFDFRELEHVYSAFLMLDELKDESLDQDVYSDLQDFLRTLEWYTARANLNDVQGRILRLKVGKMRNQDIARLVNEEYGKSYTANYISTIFRQKIIPQINAAAAFHAKVVENLPYPENFKQCKCCGETLLIDEENFVHRQRSSDGFSNRCKRCDKKIREGKIK